jgi:hypothetical protein
MINMIDMLDIMSIFNGSVITISTLIFLLGLVAIKSARSSMARAFIILTGALAYTALFVGPLQLLSYGKPVTLEWINRDLPEAEVLHAELREGVGIFLLLDWYGVPRYYQIPWNMNHAQQLIEAMEQAHQSAGGGQRPGSMPPSSEGEGGGEQQDPLDKLLGPVGDGQSDTQSQELEQRENEVARGVMSNAGNGRVMMRDPFKAREAPEVGIFGEQRGESTEGKGPGGKYDDEASEAMFYPAPQERYPEKVAPQ